MIEWSTLWKKIEKVRKLRPPTTDLPIFVLQYNNNNNSSSSNSNNNHNTLNSFRPQFGIDKKNEINSILESEILTSQQQQQQQQQNRHQLLTFQTPEIKKEETEIPCSTSTPPMFQNNVKIFNRDFFQQPLKSEIGMTPIPIPQCVSEVWTSLTWFVSLILSLNQNIARTSNVSNKW